MSEKLKRKNSSCEKIVEEEKKSPAAVHPGFKPPRRVGALILINHNSAKK